ncbi:AzlC family ABC transporter permease [Enorma phocaeensis]|uniref:AzlC family ABC transporter permease n=1 Tax=Enorma phocaeensis TaxID=1871019 RepID=UPI001DA47A01|nr:AzlC family ABC transporter permease [Enorma phocaeensis]
MRAAFPLTVPILAGFVFLGITCGIYAGSLGLPWWVPVLMSIVIFAGSAEFVVASQLAGAFDPLTTFAVVLIINARHLFYGLSMLECFRGLGRKRPYLIFGMCDETFSINYATEPPEGIDLIVGLAGERYTTSFKFYAVFQENEEFTVRSESAELGTIVNPPPPGERIAIAGACWVVEEVDWKRHLVYCTQVKGRVPAYFGDCPGDIHTHVLERMRRLLATHETYPYLLANARARLAQARRTAELSGAAAEPLINLGGDTWVLIPWLGSYGFLALERLIKIKCAKELGISGVDASRPYFLQFKMKADAETFFRVLADEADALEDPIELVYPSEVPYFDKYDELLPAELVRKGFAEGVLDVEGMRRCVREWGWHLHPTAFSASGDDSVM